MISIHFWVRFEKRGHVSTMVLATQGVPQQSSKSRRLDDSQVAGRDDLRVPQEDHIGDGRGVRGLVVCRRDERGEFVTDLAEEVRVPDAVRGG